MIKQYINLDKNDTEVFIEHLLNAPEPNINLLDAVSVYKKVVKSNKSNRSSKLKNTITNNKK